MSPSTEINYALMIYNANRDYNVGDYIQSLAAKQFLPRVDHYICREALNRFAGPKSKVILNGWFMDNPNWPPSEHVDPLFVSFHLSAHIADRLLHPAAIQYFKRFAPIGCRDPQTVSFLNEHGIDAYWSGCLTTTLNLTYKREPSDEVVVCDLLFDSPDYASMLRSPRTAYRFFKRGQLFAGGKRTRLLNRLLSRDLMRQAIWTTNKFSRSESHEQRFRRADAALRQFARAKFVVTSRIHCALPCLAMGTPVLFVHEGLDNASDRGRLSGILDLLNVVYIDREEKIDNRDAPFFDGPLSLDANFRNPERHLPLQQSLIETCRKFVAAPTMPGVLSHA